MLRNEQGGVVLLRRELHPVALLIVARLADADDAVLWEDYPELAESSHAELVEAVAELAADLARQAARYDLGIDPANILEAIR